MTTNGVDLGHNGLMDEVLLRPIQEADLDDLCRYSTHPEAAGEFEWTGFTDPKAMRRRWEEDGWLGPNGRLAVVSADSLVGDVGYTDRSPGASTRAIYEIGIALFPERRGHRAPAGALGGDRGGGPRPRRPPPGRRLPSLRPTAGHLQGAGAVARKVLTLVDYGLGDGQIRCLTQPLAAA
jgi:hypothetical protein